MNVGSKSQATWAASSYELNRHAHSLVEVNESPVRSPWKPGLAAWLSSCKPERSEAFLIMEELDVAVNFWTRSRTWKPFWILIVQDSRIVNVHTKTVAEAQVRHQLHDLPQTHRLLTLWVTYVACCEAPVLVPNSSVLIRSYPCVPWYFIFNVIRSCDVSPS